ncbi:hypothetical protein [Mesorhizobium sp. A556]
MINKLILGAFALTMISGTAFADTSTATPTATPDPSVFDKQETMAPFYTDSAMKTMKSDEDFKAAWMAMSKEDQDAVMKGCGDEAIAKEHNDFCASTKKLGGAN